MSKLFITCFTFFLCSFIINGQQRSFVSKGDVKAPIFSTHSNGIQSDDTLNYFDSPGAIYNVTDDGFVAGTNKYGDLGKYQRFDLSQNFSLKGFLFYTFVRVQHTPSDTISFVVKTVTTGGAPGTTLATIKRATNLLNTNGFSFFTLTSPIQVSTAIFIGYEWSATVKDTFGLASDQAALGLGNGANRAWEKWNDGTYIAMDDPNSWGAGFDADLWIGAIGTTIATPVELTSFTANVSGKSVVLNWTTVTEKNNRGFEIQRSTDKLSFSTIAFVNGNGTSTEIKKYSFVDNNVVSAKYYYRLKQLDFDGSYQYSSIAETGIAVATSYNLEQNYPNPFNPSTQIKYSLLSNSNVTITVFNALGKSIKVLANEVQQSGVHAVNFNASGLSSGIYFYSIRANAVDGSKNFSSTKKMILMK